MFTRVVEITCKSGKAKELSNTINERIRRRSRSGVRHGIHSDSGIEFLEQ